MRASRFTNWTLLLLLAVWMGCGTETTTETPPTNDTSANGLPAPEAGGGQPGDTTPAGNASSQPGAQSQPGAAASSQPVETTGNETKEPAARDAEPNEDIVFKYLSSEMTAAMVLHPHRALASDFIQELGITAELQQAIDAPFDPMQLEHVIVMVAPSAGDNPKPRVGSVFTFRSKETLEDIRKQRPFTDLEPVPFEGKTYHRMKPFHFEKQIEKREGAGPQNPDALGDESLNTEEGDVPSRQPDGEKKGDEEEYADDNDQDERDDELEDDELKDGELKDGEFEDDVPLEDMPQEREAFYFPDETTMVVAQESLLKSMLTANNVDTQLTQRLSAIDANHDLIVVAIMSPFSDTLDELNNAPLPLPPQAKILLGLAGQFKSIELVADVTGKSLLELKVEAVNAEAAEQLLFMGTALVDGLKKQFAENREEMLSQLPPEQAEGLFKTGEELATGMSVAGNGTQVTLVLPQPDSWNKLPGLLVPLIAEARAAAERTRMTNRFRNISLALHAHAFKHDGFPAAAAAAKEEGPPVSWRVKILPDLERQDLYDEYRLDEPWDSEHNLALLKKMPAEFGTDAEGNTSVMGLVGVGTFFQRDESREISQVTDGMSNTVMFVVAAPGKVVPWTKPEDLAFDPDDPFAALGEIDDEGLVVGFGDASVRTLPADIKPETLKALITVAGAEVIDFDELEP